MHRANESPEYVDFFFPMVMLLWSVQDKCLVPIRAVLASLTFLLCLQGPLLPTLSFVFCGLGRCSATPPLHPGDFLDYVL